MHPIDKYLVPIVNLSGNVKQIARRNPRQAGLACGAVLIIIGIIMALSGPSQPKGPIIQPLNLPNLAVASPGLNSSPAINAEQPLVGKDAAQPLLQGSSQGGAAP